MKIIIPIANLDLPELILHLQEIEELSFELDESQEYSEVQGESISNDANNPYYQLTFEDWTNIIVPIMNVSAAMISLFAAVWPTLRKSPKPSIIIENVHIHLDRNLDAAQVAEMVQSKVAEIGQSQREVGQVTIDNQDHSGQNSDATESVE